MSLVSVVIPLYNKEAHIQRTINSVLAQNIQDFEILVIDDGSTDKSAEVVLSITDPRIRLIQQKNAGVSAARNRGVKEAKADLIAFLDADDEWMPTFLETILRLRKNYPNAGAYATAYNTFTKNKRTQIFDNKVIPQSPWEGLLPNYFRAAAVGQYPVCSSAVAIPKEVFLKVGVFAVGAWLGEDVDMWGRIALKYQIAYSRLQGAIYHQEAENRACNRKISIEEQPFIKSSQNAIDNNQVPMDILGDLIEYIASLKIDTAYCNLFAGDNCTALKILLNCKTKLLYKRKLMWTFCSIIPNNHFQILYKFSKKCYVTYLEKHRNLNVTMDTVKAGE
ncbi:glycosyltransferase family 2 protein [Methanosarcina mazei]|nr:glycosyltransferase family A protein [Methanosarcina mazei]